MYQDEPDKCFVCDMQYEKRKYQAKVRSQEMYRFWYQQSKKEAAGSAGKALGEELVKMAREQLGARRRRLKTPRKATRKIQSARYVKPKPARAAKPAGPITVPDGHIVIKRTRILE
jgi:hypothetical protein